MVKQYPFHSVFIVKISTLCIPEHTVPKRVSKLSLRSSKQTDALYIANIEALCIKASFQTPTSTSPQDVYSVS